MKKYLILLTLLSGILLNAQTFEKTKDMKMYKGFFNFYYDESSDKIFIEVNKLDQEFLYVNSLAAGLGSNDIGLDRGQLGTTAVVKFKKAGNKLLLIQPNLKYRAITDNIEEKKSVEEAFAQSVLFGFKIVETKSKKYLVDVSKFLLRDAHGVSSRLKRSNQGSYSLDLSKSAFYLDRTKAFPKNVEFEALLTFKGEAKGGFVRSVSPNSSLITVRQHHSFIELPDNNFEPRKYDPRSGAIGMSYLDYATPVTSSIKKRFVIRHRLEKKDVNVELSEPKEPIIYYLDRGAPEPVKSALLEGGSWWNQAFEAAGYKDAFQIKVLPEGADPLDIRYNVVQWVHRSTRGWSYGGSVVDPRTGEILKGHVSLGSLRIRQDYLIAQSLLGATDKTGEENELLQFALGRIRQLSAHEIGHTLGFTHNFASSVNNRASVMDYPHPYIKLVENKIDVSEAYDTGIGEWDKVTVAYLYKDFPEGVNENIELNNILKKAIDKGLHFISDSDSRASGGAHINAHLWDNGENAATELERVLKVRETAMDNFSEANIHSNEPYSVLEDVFVPLYFFHRYQAEAAAKMIGGMEYSYAVKGDGQVITKAVDPKVEKAVLISILKSMDANTLAIPKHIVDLFPPRAPNYGRSRESFSSKNGVAFDALNAASTATEFVLNFVLHPERASRMIQQKAFNSEQLGFDELLNTLLDNSIKKVQKDPYLIEIQQNINSVMLQKILELSVNDRISFQAKAILVSKIKELNTWLKNSNLKYKDGYLQIIESYYKNPNQFKINKSPQKPDGSPIGSTSCNLGHL